MLDFQLQVFGVDTPEQVEQARDQARPPRLVAGAEPGAVITVEVFMEEDQIAPVRIVLVNGGFFAISVCGSQLWIRFLRKPVS